MPFDDTLVTPVAELPGHSGSEPPPGPDVPLPEEVEFRPQRRWRAALIVTGILLACALVWSLASAFLLARGIERIPAADLPSLDMGGAGPTNYLLVGTDSREDLPAELGDYFGDFGGERADVVMIVHIADGRLQMLSLPRDLKVDIPGRGADRINAAYAYGGPDLLIAAVKQLTGLPIHHYLEVRFGDFAGVVDALGGVAIDFPYAARDEKSGLAVEAGTDRLNGAQAVSYVRSRSYEELRAGTWVAQAQGDIPRTARQQQVVDELLASATRPTRFFTLPFVARSLGASLRADAGLSAGTLARLGIAVARSSATETATLPSRNAPSGGVSYLAAIEPDATELIQAFGAGESLVQLPPGG